MNEQQAAQSIIDQLIKNIGYYSDEKPQLMTIDNQTCVVWEAGPCDWPLNDGYGLYEELRPMMEEFGKVEPYKERAFFEAPNGEFEIEPLNSYSLAIYKD